MPLRFSLLIYFTSFTLLIYKNVRVQSILSDCSGTTWRLQSSGPMLYVDIEDSF